MANGVNVASSGGGISVVEGQQDGGLAAASLFGRQDGGTAPSSAAMASMGGVHHVTPRDVIITGQR